MQIIQHYDFDAKTHLGFTKMGVVRPALTPYGKTLSVLSWVFYSEGILKLDLPEGHQLVELPATETPSEGDIRIHDKFYSFSQCYRQLHTDEELLAHIRRVRDSELSKCDPLVMRHISQPENAKTLTEAQYAELQGYMQALRDFPANVDLDNIIWPPKPAFIL